MMMLTSKPSFAILLWDGWAALILGYITCNNRCACFAGPLQSVMPTKKSTLATMEFGSVCGQPHVQIRNAIEHMEHMAVDQCPVLLLFTSNDQTRPVGMYTYPFLDGGLWLGSDAYPKQHELSTWQPTIHCLGGSKRSHDMTTTQSGNPLPLNQG